MSLNRSMSTALSAYLLLTLLGSCDTPAPKEDPPASKVASEKTAPPATPQPTPTATPSQGVSEAELQKLFATPPLTYPQVKEAIKASERNIPMSENDYKITMQKRGTALKEIRGYLKNMYGKENPYVLKAFAEVPREYYYFDYSGKQSLLSLAYNSPAVPHPIGFGSAISDHLGQAMMTQLADPKPGETSLEIGTGSGYQSSILSRIVDHSYSIEIIEPLGKAVAKLYKPIQFDNVTTKVGDGFYGWPEVKGGFDIIMLTCVARYVPPPLLQQLKPGGRLIIPLGTPFKQNQTLYLYTKDAKGKVKSRSVTGVYFIPMTGKMFK